MLTDNSECLSCVPINFSCSFNERVIFFAQLQKLLNIKVIVHLRNFILATGTVLNSAACMTAIPPTLIQLWVKVVDELRDFTQ